MNSNRVKKKNGYRKFSSIYVDGAERAPSRSMLRAVGFKDEDFQKPVVGIASTWSMVTPCNMHIDKLALEAGHGVDSSGGKSIIFNTITVSDGISMGTPGMRYSLVSREVIADSIETVSGAEGFDGLVAIGGCDKNMPGCLIAMSRLNRPSVFVYGGTIMPGAYCGKLVDIVSVFEAVGAHANRTIDDNELIAIESCAIPGPGSCGGMYTANTMASAIEALGMSLPNSSAHASGVRLSLDDFTRIGRKVPVLADLKPSGKYFMSEFCKIGGLTPLMKMLLEAGLLHGDCLTVTGKTVGENLKDVKPYPNGQEIVASFNNPIKKDSHIVILYGNLAKGGAVAKITGKEGLSFTGKAIVFDSEEACLKAILDGRVKKGHVIVIRYEGPKGGPGMREMLSPTSAVMGKGLGQDVALITDGRFSGGSHGFVVGHITPEAYEGGVIAVVKNGDIISIDAKKREINLLVPDKEIKRRLNAWKRPKPKETRGALAKYARLVTSASEGAVTDKNF